MISLDEARDYVDNVIRESQMDSQTEIGLDFPHALLAILRQPAADRWAADTATSLQGRAFMIRAELQEPSKTILYEAVVRLTNNPAQPYWLLSWRAR